VARRKGTDSSRRTEYAWDTIANEEVHVGYIEDWPDDANRKQDWRGVKPLRKGAKKAEHGDGSARYRCCGNQRCASAVFVAQKGINQWHFRRSNDDPRKPPVCQRRDHYVGESSYHWKTTLQIKKLLEHKMRTQTEWLGQTIMKVEREVLRHFATGDAGIQLKPDVYVRFDNGDWLVVEVVYTHAPDQKNADAYNHLKSSSNQFGPRIIELNLNQYIDGDITDRTFAKWVQQGGMENALDFETQLEHREERFVKRKMKFGEKARIERVRGIERILSSLQKDFPHLGRLDVEVDEGQELHLIEDAFIQAHRDYLEIQPIVENWEQTYPGFDLPTEYREAPKSTDFSKRFWEIEDTAKKGTEYLNGILKKMEDEEVSPEAITQVKEHTFSPQDYPSIENYKRYLDDFCDSLVKKYREEEAIEHLEELKLETQIKPPTLLGDQTNLTERLIEWYTRAKQDQQTALRIVEEKIESHKLNEFHHEYTGDDSGVYIRDLVIPKYSNFDEIKYAARVDKKFSELAKEDQIRICENNHGITMPDFPRGIPKIVNRKDVEEWYERAVKHREVSEEKRSEYVDKVADKFGIDSFHREEINKIPIDYTNFEEDVNLHIVVKKYGELIQLDSDRKSQLVYKFGKSRDEQSVANEGRNDLRRKKPEPFNPFSRDASEQRKFQLESAQKKKQSKPKKHEPSDPWSKEATSKKKARRKKDKEKQNDNLNWLKDHETRLRGDLAEAKTKRKKTEAQRKLNAFLQNNQHKYKKKPS